MYLLSHKLVSIKSFHEVMKCHNLMIVGSLSKVVRYIFIFIMGHFVEFNFVR